MWTDDHSLAIIWAAEVEKKQFKSELIFLGKNFNFLDFNISSNAAVFFLNFQL